MFSHLSFNCVLLLLLLLPTRSLEDEYIVEVGRNAYLPCSYTPTSPGHLIPVCWGKEACPVFGCGTKVLSIDETNVTYRASSRYWLRGNFHKGDVSLTIENVTLADSGTYCCRIEVPGLMNDKKFDRKLVIKPVAKVIPSPTLQRHVTVAFPRMPTTSGGYDSETQTLGILQDKNQTQISTLANELQDPGASTRIAVYIGAGISAGLALALIFGALLFKWYSHRKEKLQNSRLISFANLQPSGLENAVAAGMRSEENIYIIEENVYEMEDPNEYYCSIQQKYLRPTSPFGERTGAVFFTEGEAVTGTQILLPGGKKAEVSSQLSCQHQIFNGNTASPPLHVKNESTTRAYCCLKTAAPQAMTKLLPCCMQKTLIARATGSLFVSRSHFGSLVV
ncbi:hepatitis A virus cellular receptor 2 [Eulemur rufifrons]|uniref:hepatitis A virus cellular receptor 2 n=1 Tax=Eulemur rufifrons TaxID=859984 RepID=UPI0037447CEA